ncbi:hypothetical protein F5J12DRAFT_928970 [Pisolithus orientalis]|uniref:uncharacterized protein n=1 Tax=Pisolithus orientalis TaxID=936130 RepID=UPI00222457CB|nr:uncharacterized protein F5J12DRAFT_928970 [Pisolithus orientalis]KAI5997611.1 hypothetical protein F5J12DRAFT_928970 [Pisolithus orientalis]
MLGLKIPCRGSPEAPSFSGHPEDLQSYFDDIIDFCDGFGLSDGPERIRFALKYAPFESADLWSHFVSSSQGDWARFTSEITQQYPELQEITRNKFYKLRKVLASSETISTSSLGEYYRIFCRLSLSLEKEHGLLPHLTSSFFYGFPPEFRQELLEFHDPPAQTFTVPSLIAAAGRVLALGDGLWKSRKVDSSRAQPPHASDNRSPRRSYSFCFFCGLSGHIRAGCHSFKSYLASGKCLLVDGRVVLPTGLEIPREVAGRTLRDRLDNWSLLTSQFEARMGSSPARSLSPTAAPSRSVFNAPSHIPAQTSIGSTRSLPTLQLEPALTACAATVEVATWPRPVALASSFTVVLTDSNEFLTLFFLVLVLVLALSLTLKESAFTRPLQAEAVAQPQSRAPALSKISSMDLPMLEFPTERRLASHLAPSRDLHDASHPRIQF